MVFQEMDSFLWLRTEKKRTDRWETNYAVGPAAGGFGPVHGCFCLISNPAAVRPVWLDSTFFLRGHGESLPGCEFRSDFSQRFSQPASQKLAGPANPDKNKGLRGQPSVERRGRDSNPQ